MSATAHVGSLREILGDVAWRIKSRCQTTVQVVGANEQGEVFSSEFGAPFDIIAAEHIGTYTLLATEDDIEGDLRIVLRSRAGQWLLN